MAVVGLTAVQRSAGPTMPVTAAKVVAFKEEMARRTSGRDLVLAICASKGTSCSWLRALAEAEQSAVPSAVERRTGRVAGAGERATPDMADRTTRTESFDLDSCRYALSAPRGGGE